MASSPDAAQSTGASSQLSPKGVTHDMYSSVEPPPHSQHASVGGTPSSLMYDDDVLRHLPLRAVEAQSYPPADIQPGGDEWQCSGTQHSAAVHCPELQSATCIGTRVPQNSQLKEQHASISDDQDDWQYVVLPLHV